MDKSTKQTITILGVGVVAFLGVRYLMNKNKKDEQHSNFRGRTRPSERVGISIVDNKYAVCDATGDTIEINAPTTNASTINAFRQACEDAGGSIIETNYLPHGASLVRS